MLKAFHNAPKGGGGIDTGPSVPAIYLCICASISVIYDACAEFVPTGYGRMWTNFISASPTASCAAAFQTVRLLIARDA